MRMQKIRALLFSAALLLPGSIVFADCSAIAEVTDVQNDGYEGWTIFKIIVVAQCPNNCSGWVYIEYDVRNGDRDRTYSGQKTSLRYQFNGDGQAESFGKHSKYFTTHKVNHRPRAGEGRVWAVDARIKSVTCLSASPS